MPVKLIHFAREARADIEEGVRKLAAAVKVTLGPQGKVVAIEKKWGAPLVTKDGVTVAREVELEDRFENAATQLVREVAVRTSEAGGDGTTTATILAEAIFLSSLHNVEAGADPLALERGVRRAVEAAEKALEKASRPVKSNKDIENVATVASNNDPEIGKIIAEAIGKVGAQGAITVEEGRGIRTEVELIEGFQYDKGYLSPHFINRPKKLLCELEDAYILVCEQKIDSVKPMVPLVEAVARTGRPLLILAESVSGEALALLVVNRLRGVFQSCATQAPSFGDRRKEMLEDIAVLTGARPLMSDLGVDLESVRVGDLGRAKRVIVEKEKTTVMRGAGKKADVEARIGQLRRRAEEEESEFNREKLQERLAKLSGGVAQINVGAATEVEMKERHARIEDALHAARAAEQEGVLPGGGVALARAAKALEALKAEGDEKVGIDIVRRALDRPLRQIAENAGLDGSVVAARVLEKDDPDHGYNAWTGKYEDLAKAGVLDSRKVLRLALRNAASVATILLTTEAIITEKPGEKTPMPPGMGGGMPPM